MTKTLKASLLVVSEIIAACLRCDIATTRNVQDIRREDKEVDVARRFKLITPIMLTVLLMGLRMKDALRLSWNEIDFDAGELRVPHAMNVRKLDGQRLLSLSPATRSILRMLDSGEKDLQASVFGLSSADASALIRRMKRMHYLPSDFAWNRASGHRKFVIDLRRSSYETPNVPGTIEAAMGVERWAGQALTVLEACLAAIARNGELPGDYADRLDRVRDDDVFDFREFPLGLCHENYIVAHCTECGERGLYRPGSFSNGEAVTCSSFRHTASWWDTSMIARNAGEWSPKKICTPGMDEEPKSIAGEQRTKA